MEAVAYSWLAAASCSPLLIMLAVWTLYIFHTYRRQWRMVDLFFLAVVAQEMVTSSFAFAFAVFRLINPSLEPACVFLQWGLTSTRAFQIATLASLAVDRGLTLRWPYKYRLSVRRNQIRYHIAVLAVISVFVGVAAVFARVPGRGPCSVRPSAWDEKFSVFLLSLYAVLVLTSFVCCAHVVCHKCKKRTGKKEPLPVTDFGTSCSGTGSSSSGGSSRPLRPLRSYNNDFTTLDMRWTAVSSVCICCYTVNHVPFLVFNVVSLVVPTFWSAWQENIIVWLRLLESLLIPAILYFTDLPHRGAVKKAFQRKSGRFPDNNGTDNRIRPYLDDILSGHKIGPGNYLSSFHQPNDLPVMRHLAIFGNRVGWHDHILSNVYSLPQHNDAYSKNLHMMAEPRSYLTKQCNMDNDLPEYSVDTWKEDGSHIYATLSESASFQSVFTNDNMELAEDGESVTTDANDDFEFHEVRPTQQQQQQQQEHHLHHHHQQQQLYPDEKEQFEDQPEYSIDTTSDSDDDDDDDDEDDEVEVCNDQFLQVYKMSMEQLQNNAVAKSCSMASMDDEGVSTDDEEEDEEEEEEEIYVLPVAPRSSMALYKLQLPRPFKARSENDLTWLSKAVDSDSNHEKIPEEKCGRSAILDALNKNTKRNVKRRTSLKESAIGGPSPSSNNVTLSGFV
ncbi:uncharacterized protein [Centruroides vittatus]|uniref:uncharacterized protein n=1 Tax=Centruroides vittatus TaxID=120091 RepID=UPI00350FF795